MVTRAGRSGKSATNEALSTGNVSYGARVQRFSEQAFRGVLRRYSSSYLGRVGWSINAPAATVANVPVQSFMFVEQTRPLRACQTPPCQLRACCSKRSRLDLRSSFLLHLQFHHLHGDSSQLLPIRTSNSTGVCCCCEPLQCTLLVRGSHKLFVSATASRRAQTPLFPPQHFSRAQASTYPPSRPLFHFSSSPAFPAHCSPAAFLLLCSAAFPFALHLITEQHTSTRPSYSPIFSSSSAELSRTMTVLTALAAYLAATANGNPLPVPQGVTARLPANGATPAGCKLSYGGQFGITVVRTNGLLKREFVLTLSSRSWTLLMPMQSDPVGQIGDGQIQNPSAGQQPGSGAQQPGSGAQQPGSGAQASPSSPASAGSSSVGSPAAVSPSPAPQVTAIGDGQPQAPPSKRRQVNMPSSYPSIIIT